MCVFFVGSHHFVWFSCWFPFEKGPHNTNRVPTPVAQWIPPLFFAFFVSARVPFKLNQPRMDALFFPRGAGGGGGGGGGGEGAQITSICLRIF